ncbi:uncharacterized protein BDV17DRAFT_251202 [Aspergillus undulatus]|uniref:uncharacterized protein n=1 Tax=Aspergillus undulatus TaxID=1810928 RepID=UPI003CCE4276
MSLRRRIAWTWLAQAQAHATHNSPASFLYQTPTLLSIRSYWSEDGARNYTRSVELKKSDKTRPSFLRQKAATVARPTGITKRWEAPQEEDTARKRKKMQMTTHETRTLQDLFSQLKPLEMKHNPHDPLEKPEETEEDKAKKVERDEIFATFDMILEELQKPEPPQSEQKNEENKPPISIERGDKSFPLPEDHKELRKLAWRRNVSEADQIELLIKRESMHIENALNAAVSKGEKEETGETELWRVCQEMIFPMVQHLRGPSAPTPTPLEQPDANDSDDAAVPIIAPEPFKVPHWLPADIITAGVYPKSLRKAFNLLNVHFPESPLIPRFRQVITSLGPESAMLGMSTGLYNDMMYFHWRVAHDLSEVVAIGREMVLTGARVDQGTLGILDRIVLERNRHIRTREQGETSSSPWWEFPPNRKALRDLLGTGGLISKLKNQYRDTKKKKEMGRPFL